MTRRVKRRSTPAAHTIAPGARTIIKVACYALTMLLMAAALVWYGTSRPVSRQVPPDPWKLATDDRLILVPLVGKTLLTIEGADNEGIDVHFDRARLDDGTVKSLHDDFAITVPTSDGPIAWTTTHPGTGHTMLEIELEASHGVPEVEIAHTGQGPHPGLSIASHGTHLLVRLSVPLGVEGTGAAPVIPEQKALQMARHDVVYLPGAVPLTVLVQEGQSLKVVFPSPTPTSTLQLGTDDSNGTTSGLALRSAAMRPVGSDIDVRYACAAPETQDYLKLSGPAIADCATTGTLRATQIDLGRNNVAVTIHGSAWFAKDGDFVIDDWFSRYVSANVVLVGLIGSIVGALSTIVLAAVLGRRD